MSKNPMIAKLDALEWQWKMRALYEKGALPIEDAIVYKPNTENQEAVSFVPAIEMRNARFAKHIEAEKSGPAYYIKSVERHFDKELNSSEKDLAEKINEGFTKAHKEVQETYSGPKNKVQREAAIKTLEEKKNLSIRALEKRCDRIKNDFYVLAGKETKLLKEEIQDARMLAERGIPTEYTDYVKCLPALSQKTENPTKRTEQSVAPLIFDKRHTEIQNPAQLQQGPAHSQNHSTSPKRSG